MTLAEKLYKNRNWLENKYVKELMTTREIGDLFNISKTTIIRWMKRFDIPRRSNAESRNLYYKTHNGYWLGKLLSKETKKKMSKSNSGEKASRWNGGSDRYYRSISKKVWEEYWREELPDGYVIHHFDGDLKNFDITNLPLLTDKFHRQLPKRKEVRL